MTFHYSDEYTIRMFKPPTSSRGLGCVGKRIDIAFADETISGGDKLFKHPFLSLKF